VEALHSLEAFGGQQTKSAAKRSRETTLSGGEVAENPVKGACICIC